MAGLATRIGQGLQEPFYQGFLLLLLLITLFLSKPLFSGHPLLAADILFGVDPLWQPLAPVGFDGPANPILSDQAFEFYPWQKFVREELAQGRIPLWNPYVNGGHPLVANAQSAIFAPFNVIALLWPLAQSFVVVAFLRLLCAGTFTLLLALELGLSRYAAFLAMIIFTFAAPQIVWLLYPKASVLVWLPAILFLSLRIIRTGRWRTVGWLGLVMAAQLVGGHPETSFYIVLTWFAFCGYWLWMQANEENQPGTYPLRRTLVQLGAAGVLGLGAGAIQLLPTAEALWQSEILVERNQAALSWQTFVFQWSEWLAAATMLMPNFFGNPRHHDYWYPYSNFNEQTMFVGVLPLALAILVYLKGKRREATFFLVLAVVTLGFALRLPGFALLAEAPGLSITNSGRMRGIYMLAIALLSGYGLDIVLQSIVLQSTGRQNLASAEDNALKLLTRLFLLFGVVAAVGAGAAYLIGAFYQEQLVALGRAQIRGAESNPFFFRPPEEYAALLTTRVQEMVASFYPANWTMYLPLLLALAFIVFVALVARMVHRDEQRARAISLVIVALVVGELWFVGLDFNSTTAPELIYPTPPLVDSLIQEYALEGTQPERVVGWGLALVPNVSMVFGLEDIRGYDPIAPGRYMNLVGHLSGAVRVGHHLLFDELTAPLLDFLNVRYAFVPEMAEAGAESGEVLDERWIPIQQEDGVTLYANSEAMPRAFMVYSSQRANSPEESLAMTLASDFDFRNLVVLEGVAEPLVQLPPSLSALVEMTKTHAGETIIDVETAMPGYLVISDPYTTGWVAEIDGEETPLLIANHAFRSVAVPEGNHRVTLRYQPISIVVGAWISTISLIFLILLVIFGGRKPDGHTT